MKFNLVEKKWITVTRLDGYVEEVSLSTCVDEASSIRKISMDLPTQSFAVLRVLLAICHDAIGIHDNKAALDIRKRGLPIKLLSEYLDRYRERFDLFHPERPFMQVADLRTAKGDVSGLEKIIADVPNGSPFMTMRGGNALQRIGFAEAARWLVHCQAFDASGIRSAAVGDPDTKSGRGYPIGPSWVGQIGGVVLHGESLAETLGFNLVPTPKNALDRPVWALDTPQTQLRMTRNPEPPGPVSLLVWQSRRIRLIHDGEAVTGVVLAQGDKMTPQNRHEVEAMTAWRYSRAQTKKAGITIYMPLKHNPARAGWRGMPALLASSPRQEDGHDETRPPSTVEELARDLVTTGVSRSFVLEQVGMSYGSQEATVAELFHDTYDLRISLLGEEAHHVRTMMEDAVRTADECVRYLGVMAANVARAAGDFDSTKSSEKGPFADITVAAWAAIDSPARKWLSELSADVDLTEKECQWQRMLRDVLERKATKILNTCSPAAIAGRKTKDGYMTAAKAEIFFRSALRKKLPLAFHDNNEGDVR